MKLLRLLLFRWKSIILTLVVLLYFVLRFVIARPVSDPDALVMPLYGAIINADRVNIEVISVNGTQAPGDSLKNMVVAFDKYVRGEVNLVEAPPVQLDLKEGENPSCDQAKTILEKRQFRGPADITLLLLPGNGFLGEKVICGGCFWPWSDYLGQLNHAVIVIHAARCDWFAKVLPFFSREQFWTLLMTHEIFHTFGVPSDAGRQHSPPGRGLHCANPWCLLYWWPDLRAVAWGLTHFKIPSDLCTDCQREIFEYQSNLSTPLPTSEPFDAELYWMNGLVELNPSDPKAYQTQSSIFFHRGEYAKAVESCSRGLELDPRLPKFYQTRASSYLYLQEYAKAIHDCSRGLEIDPQNPWLYGKRGFAYQETGKAEEALRDFAKAIESVTPSLDKSNGFAKDCMARRAMIYCDMKDHEKARYECTRAIEMVPDEWVNYRNRGIICARSEDYTSAIEDFSRAIALNENDAASYSCRADSFQRSDDAPAAVVDYMTAAGLNPNDDICFNQLAWLLATEPDETLRDGGWAVELATQACEKTGWTNAAYLDTLGAAYAERGDFETAVEYTQQAMALICDSTEEALYQEHLDSYQKREPVRRIPRSTESKE